MIVNAIVGLFAGLTTMGIIGSFITKTFDLQGTDEVIVITDKEDQPVPVYIPIPRPQININLSSSSQ